MSQNQFRMVSNEDEDLDNLSEIADLLLREKCLTRKQIEYAARVRSKLETPRSTLEVLKELKFITDDQIKNTVRKNRVSMSIGNFLVELGHIRAEDLQRALTIQSESQTNKKLGEILIEHRLIDERVLLEVLSLQMGFAYVEPEFEDIDKRLFSRVPPKWFDKHTLIPIRKEENKASSFVIGKMDRFDILVNLRMTYL